MASKVDIWNMALINIGSSGFIQSPTEASAEANHCRVVHDNAVEATLESLDWGFARKTAALADLGTPEDDWTFQYAYPTDCIKARKILGPTRNKKPPPFDVGINSTGTQKVINTDTKDAKLRYTMKVTNVGFFPPVFIEMLSWKIALMIAGPLSGNDTNTFEKVRKGLAAAQANAHAVESNEGQEDEAPDAPWVQEYE